jgi:RecA/RadA recombinase
MGMDARGGQGWYGGQVQQELHAERPVIRLRGVQEMDTLPEPTWVIDDVLPGDAVSMLYGKEGSGKSFLALDWALCVATNTAWVGSRVHPGPVVYIAAEGAGGFKHRRQAWEQQRGVAVPEGLFFLVDDPINLYHSRSVEQLLSAMLAGGLGTAALVIVDTLGRSLDGADENSNSDMNVVIGEADRIRRQTGAAVLLVHHTGKAAGASAPRGASALKAGVAMCAKLEVKKNSLSLSCEKMKESRAFDTMRASLVEVALSEGNSSLVVVHPDQAEKADRVAAQSSRSRKPRSPRKPRLSQDTIYAAVEAAPNSSPSEIASRLGAARNPVQKHLARLEAAGKIIGEGGRYRPAPNPLSEPAA